METIGQYEISSIDSQIRHNLEKCSINSFFPVQKSVIPLLLNYNSFLNVQPRDLCISAPTGSGKTIAFVVPILNVLKYRKVVRLRALILLPSRELASQVYGVFCALSDGLGLRILLAAGQNDLKEERRILMGEVNSKSNYLEPVNPLLTNNHLFKQHPSSDYHGNIDILVCTPGRLQEHLHSTEGFTLRHLRFLVLDEADRLLGNAYHSWVKDLVQSTQSFHFSTSISQNQFEVDSIDTPLQRLLFSATLTENPRKLALLGIRHPILIRSSAATAIVSNSSNTPLSVQEVDQLGTNSQPPPQQQPTSGYRLPTNLTESVRVCDTTQRPLVLLSILVEAFESTSPPTTHKKNMCLIFCSSVDGCHRLVRLLQLFNGQFPRTGGTQGQEDLQESNEIEEDEEVLVDEMQREGESMKGDNDQSTKKRERDEESQFSSLDHSSPRPFFDGLVEEMSSQVRSNERKRIMRDCSIGKVKILVCTDQMARGIDLPNIKLVINYDPPNFERVYVHRVGRTARAGRSGHCISLLKFGQVTSFKKMRGNIITSISNEITDPISKCKISKNTIEKITPVYRQTIRSLKSVFDQEKSSNP